MSLENDLYLPVPFGRQMRETHFMFAPEYTPLNHGSYGAYPRAVKRRLHDVQALFEARPDRFLREEYPPMLDESRITVASLINAPVDEVVLVPNASTATNVVLRSFHFEKADVVVCLSTVYGAVRKTIEYLRETTPVEGFVVPLEYPLSAEEVVDAFKAGIQDARLQGKRVRAAILDTVSSMPGVCNPWERLVQVCKDENVLSIVDGAHGIGLINLDLSKVQPDFFTSNLHKWLYVPRACALFYVPKRHQKFIRSSLPTSHGFDPLPNGDDGRIIFNPLPLDTKSPFVRLFEYVATTDSGPYLCVKAALKFREEVCGGEESIMGYCKQISDEGGKQMAELLGTDVMENKQGSLSQSAFANVRLPLRVGTNPGEIPEKQAVKVVDWLTHRLINDFDIYAPVYFHAGCFWTRLSGQIYLEIQDFVKGAEALKSLCEQAKAGVISGA